MNAFETVRVIGRPVLLRWQRGLQVLLMLGLFCLATRAQAGDLYVIANPGVSGLGAADVRDIFLGVKRFAGSTALKPADNASQQPHFLQQVVKMEGDKYNGWWMKKAFRDGLVQPEVKSSDLEVIEYVKSTAGAVGYVGAAPPASVQLVGKF